MRQKLEIVTNVAVLLVCVLTIGVIVHAWYGNRVVAPTTAARGGYSVGEHVEGLPVEIKGPKPTLLLFLKTTCQYCMKSMPFYEHLGRFSSSRGGPVRVVALGPDAESDLQTLLANNRVTVDTIASVPLARTRVPGTPTLVLVDNRGLVVNQWVGYLGPAQQEQVVRVLAEGR